MNKRLMKLMLIVLSLCFMPHSAVAADPVRIGLIVDLSGPLNSEGRQAKQVVELLLAQINEAGGVLGRALELVVEDDAGAPHEAVAAAKRLVSRKVVGAIGAYSSSITEAVQPVFDAAGVIQISHGSTAVPLTQQGYRYFFRTGPRDDQQAPVVAEALKQSGARRVAVVHDPSLYSRRLAAKTIKQLRANGTEVVAKVSIDAGAKDYTEALKKLQAVAPDRVLFTGYYPETGVLLKDSRALGWNVPFFGTDASNNPELVKIAGIPATKGFCFSSLPLLANLPALEAKQFLQAFQEHYGHRLESIYALLAGDALDVLVYAIAQTGSTDADKIAAFLHDQLESFAGMSGLLSYDANGDREAQLYVDYCLDQNGNAVLQF